MRKVLVTLSLVLLSLALPLAAQSLTGTVTGTVKDDQGGVLPGVTRHPRSARPATARP